MSNTTKQNIYTYSGDWKNLPNEIKQVIDQAGIVFSDLDDVVQQTAYYTCGSTWYEDQIYHANRTHFDMYDDFLVCIKKARYTAVDSDLNKYLTSLSSEKPVFALTARHVSYKTYTEKALDQMQVRFSVLDKVEKCEFNNIDIVENGIIYANHDPYGVVNKATVLSALTKDCLADFAGMRKVIIDDSKRHVDEFVAKCKEIGIGECFGIHYTKVKTELSKKPFTINDYLKIGETQFQAILNDLPYVPSPEEIVLPVKFGQISLGVGSGNSTHIDYTSNYLFQVRNLMLPDNLEEKYLNNYQSQSSHYDNLRFLCDDNENIYLPSWFGNNFTKAPFKTSFSNFFNDFEMSNLYNFGFNLISILKNMAFSEDYAV